MFQTETSCFFLLNYNIQLPLVRGCMEGAFATHLKTIYNIPLMDAPGLLDIFSSHFQYPALNLQLCRNAIAFL
jgi:hypothetical protein